MKDLICGIAVGSILGAVLVSHPTVKRMAKQAKTKMEKMACDCVCDESRECCQDEEM